MQKPGFHSFHEENDLFKAYDLVMRNKMLFVSCIAAAIALAFLLNFYLIPAYKITSSLLIKEENVTASGANMDDFINNSLFGSNQNFQNELWVLKSSPIIEKTVRNLNLNINYFIGRGLQYTDAYDKTPFRVFLMSDHVQPTGVKFEVTITDHNNFHLTVKSGKAAIKNITQDNIPVVKKKWSFEYSGKFGDLIETSDLSFILVADSSIMEDYSYDKPVSFSIRDIPSTVAEYKENLEYNVVQQDATVVEISLKQKSLKKGIDLVNELMNVYSLQDLERKNHLAAITIEYIEKQLNEVSDSLSETENSLQSFRSSNQLLDMTEQATGISSQYRDLQNQLAILLTQKRYYEDVMQNLLNQQDISQIIIPSAMGIEDQLLNSLMADLITAHSQRSLLIESGQEKNPLVQKLTIQMDNSRETIIQNIRAAMTTTDISIDEMNKRIRRIESEIRNMPVTQQALGSIERQYKINDAIYNFLLEKRAEAKITQASNLPDNIVIEQANMSGNGPVSPNKKVNILAAFLLGLVMPFAFLRIRSILNNVIEARDNIEKNVDLPVLGKIYHNNTKSENIMFKSPKTGIAESFRSLRTNFEFYFRGSETNVILITSSVEGEGKSFVAMNLAMSFAQLDRKTILVNYDLRKPRRYFPEHDPANPGLTSYYANLADFDEIICKTPYAYLDFIPAGPIPPNPIELIALDKTKILFDQLKKNYSVIILDTTPLAQVSDAYVLMEHSNVKVLVARYDYTLKRVFTTVVQDLKHKNVDNLCLVLNNNKSLIDQYGYGYGYNNKKHVKKDSVVIS